MEFRFRNVNDAFSSMVELIHNEGYQLCEEETRNGPVLSFEDPVIITYNNPLERVLFNPGRDCNPFFHLVEALWMLAGRNDIAIPAYFASNMVNYSDDGKTFHAAYGHRWRDHFHDTYLLKEGAFAGSFKPKNKSLDQLDFVINELRRDPNTRRLCLSMWDASQDIPMLRDNPTCKDLPCNTHCYFRVTEGKYLNLTVCNRSNDMIWGTFGANLVHMSFLQEYIALCSGLEVGLYHQITNNLHTYKDKWKPTKWLKHCTDYYHTIEVTANDVPLICRHMEEMQSEAAWQSRVKQGLVDAAPARVAELKAVFDAEVIELMELLSCVASGRATDAFSGPIRSPFLDKVAWPMIQAFIAHKRNRNYLSAQTWMAKVEASDWRKAGREWLLKRERLYEKRNDPNYSEE